ncbi:MAG: hypothetical protein KC503_44455 [Myxococcales bacterium]|nr:hypothetical protein [Myxococcales bacterium]
MDGKYDSDGHLIGALTFDARTQCEHDTGDSEAEGWAGRPGDHEAGTLCRVATPELGGGRFRVNVRALVHSLDRAGDGDDASSAESSRALTIVVRDAAADRELARRIIDVSRFETAMTYRNLVVEVSRRGLGPLEVNVEWSGHHALRVEHVQVYRAKRRVLVEPRSGLLAADATLKLALFDAPDGFELRLDCNGKSLDERFATLEQDGKVTRDATEAATVVSLPAAELLEGCEGDDLRLRVQVRNSYYAVATARVTYRSAQHPCTFADEGKKPRVLLTGFEPFPARGDSDNSSEQAVLAYQGRADLDVMRVVLPVEWDSAAATLRGLIDRCKPDVIVSFGQGRSQVDVETTAYNSKDSFDIAGGAVDNRGMLFAGQPIVKDGAATLSTRLPAQDLVSALSGIGEQASTSNDPGRYICNNLFYELMHEVADSERLAGFVHLPIVSNVDDDDRERLAKIVSAIVDGIVPRREEAGR